MFPDFYVHKEFFIDQWLGRPNKYYYHKPMFTGRYRNVSVYTDRKTSSLY